MNENATSASNSDKRLQNLENEIDRMGAMAIEALAKAKTAGFNALEGLMIQQESARQRLRGVEAASGDAWQELKQGIDAAWGELSGAVSQAVTKFQDRETSERRSAAAQTAAAPSPSHAARPKPAKKSSQAPKSSRAKSTRSRTSKRKVS